MTTIAPLVPADRDDWLPLWRGYLTFYEAELSDEQTELTFERLTDTSFPMHGAIARADDGVAVGIVHWLEHVATWSATGYCYLEDLFTVPAARGGGVGTALIAHVKDWATEFGCSKVYWLTADTNATARSLYDRVANLSGFVHYEIQL